MKKNTLFIIDGSSFLYRAYYGVRPLQTSSGVPVHAVYGFCRMIKKLIDSYAPTSLLLVWDSAGKTERHTLYQDYKAHRQAAPSDLFSQKELILEFADLLGIQQVQENGIEADDLIFSAARDAHALGMNSVIVSSDKDLAQAITNSTIIFDAFKDTLIDKAAFESKMGFPLSKIVFYYSLIGDSSDNIPGAKGIGPKGALKLVNQFDSLHDMYRRLTEVKKASTREKLLASKEMVLLSEKLFTLHYYPDKIDKEKLGFSAEQWHNCAPFFNKLGFKSLIASSKQEELPLQKPARNYHLVQTEEQLAQLIQKIEAAGICALDTETTGLKPLEDSLVGISVCLEEGTAYYIPCGHTTGEQQLSIDLLKQHLGPILATKTIKKYLHNAQFDALVLLNAGMPLAGITYDSMILAHLLGNEASRIGLKFLSEHFLDEPMTSFAHLTKTLGCKTFAAIPLEKALSYAADDAHQTFLLTKLLVAKAEEANILDYYTTIEHPLIPILIKCHQEGIYVDQAILDQLDKQVMQELHEIQEQIRLFLPEETVTLNLNSPKQLEHLLFTLLGLKPVKKTSQKTGFSTDIEVLTHLAKEHPVPALIIRYRELAKIKGTYLDGLAAAINKKTGKIHTFFSQTSTATGRLASHDPNLQNIPTQKRGLPIAVRAAFRAPEDTVLMSFDYSQIELRVLAYLSQDPELLHAFAQEQDIHTKTAAYLFNTSTQAVTDEQRQMGKKINFSIIYGLTPYGLSQDLNISFKEAQEFIDRYFASYPGIKEWMNTVIIRTHKDGFVTTHWGRKRAIPGIYEKNRTLYDAAVRMAINTTVQGTAAEIMKRGMIRVEKKIEEKLLPAVILLQIHDELIISAPKHLAEDIGKIVRKELELAVDWPLKLRVNFKIGHNWEEIS
jgi:DNA polymerase-1